MVSHLSEPEHPEGVTAPVTQADLLGIIRALPDVVFRCEKRADGKIYWTFNEGRLAEEFHLTTEEIEGKSLEELFPGGASTEIRAHFEAAFRGETSEFVNEIGGRHFKHYPQPVRDADGHVVAVVGFITEVTNLTRAQREIQHLSSELATRLIEIHESNRELQTFNYTLSHDLRTPLTVIEAQCQLLDMALTPAGDEKNRDRVKKIRTAARRMLDLMEGILALSNASRAPLKRETVDLSLVAAEVAGDLAARDPGRPVDLDIASGISAAGDPKLLRQALDNLIGNAWKYSAGTPHATIRFGEAWHDGQHIYYVRDNGVGFDMQETGRLFQPFQRLGTAENFSGSGVGLATVQRIVERHGGRVWAEGRPGAGATFYFTLGNE